MSYRELERYVRDTADYLKSKVGHEGDDPSVLGWQNTFKPGRVGTTGSALPLLFFRHVRLSFGDEAQVCGSIAGRQFQGGDDRGGWAILSANTCATVEGTAWCLRALAVAGGEESRAALTLGEDWLLQAQRTDGGWGSKPGDPARTTTTAAATRALASISASNTQALADAVAWLRGAQTNNGSWGETPGADPNIAHTAMAMVAMLDAGVSHDDQAIDRGVNYLSGAWRPDCSLRIPEIYDIHSGTSAFKVTLEHDVDAGVVDLMLRLPSSRRLPEFWDAVAGIVHVGHQWDYWQARQVRPSLWNIVPRAQAVYDAAQHLIAPESGEVRWSGAATLTRRSGAAAGKLDAIKLLLLEFVPRRWVRYGLRIATTVVLMILIVLLVTGDVSVGQFLVGVALPLLLFLLTLRAPSRG